jgi:hypothetical protein
MRADRNYDQKSGDIRSADRYARQTAPKIDNIDDMPPALG